MNHGNGPNSIEGGEYGLSVNIPFKRDSADIGRNNKESALSSAQDETLPDIDDLVCSASSDGTSTVD